MIIQQYKQTPLAMAPDELSKAINKYTAHKSFVCNTLQDNADIVHFHVKNIHTNKKQLIQYHTEPFRANLKYSFTKLVIAQYHATLPEYSNCRIVRNIINFEEPLYNLNIIDKIKIGFSPSVLVKYTDWYDKGYTKTKEILDLLKSRYSIEYDIIHKVSLEECINRKSKCNIIIDECVTKSYHRSGLEGLALGKLTICSVGEDVNNIVKNIINSTLPFENVWIDDLYFSLENIIKKGINYINEVGYNNRNWMERYWHPKDIIKEYVNIYEEIYNG